MLLCYFVSLQTRVHTKDTIFVLIIFLEYDGQAKLILLGSTGDVQQHLWTVRQVGDVS